jgi:hypothetical protein
MAHTPTASADAAATPINAALGNPPPAHTPPPAAATTATGHAVLLPAAGGAPTTQVPAGEPPAGEPGSSRMSYSQVLAAATTSDAFQQLARCFPRWTRISDSLSEPALRALAANTPVDPNDTATWRGPVSHAGAVLRRHGMAKLDPFALSPQACEAITVHQAAADRDAGLDWSVLQPALSTLDGPLRAARTPLPLDLDHPATWATLRGKRAALGRRSSLDEAAVESLSHWVLEHPDDYDPADPGCWQIGTRRWLDLALATVTVPAKVMRPVGVFVTPDERSADGWRLGPVLSLELIALVDALEGTIDASLTEAVIPAARIDEFLERVNHHTLYAGDRRAAVAAVTIAEELAKVLGRSLHPGTPSDRLERWGRLDLAREGERGPLRIEALTFTVKGFTSRRLGARRGRRNDGYQLSVAMDLGEAVGYAIDHEVPLLLSTEAAGHLRDTVRVGRMKGRPGLLTITESNGLSAVTRRLVADQAIPLLRDLQAARAKVTLDAGARQLVRMTVARPLDDDPVLKDPQRRPAALKVVGSGLDMSQTATGKTITTGRAIYHRAARTERFRGLIITSTGLLEQWKEELTEGAPAHDLPPLTPNCNVTILDETRGIGEQVRRFHRECAQRGGVVLCSKGVMELYHRELAVINWHLGVADEIHRFRNPATDAHRALVWLRFNAIADFWGLTGTPNGKDPANLDRLVGISVGDRVLLEERLNTAEAGDLMDEINAARLRVNYGPHAIRVTKAEMRPYLPVMLPAEPMPIAPDRALQDLLDAAQKGGEEAFRALLEALHTLKSTDKHSQLHKAAMKEFASKQGIVLGIVDTFVDIGVDPETLTHSQGLLAKALVRDGLVAEAMHGGGDGLPLLRSIVAQTLAERAQTEQMLVFAERVWCLRQLAGTIRQRYGVEAHVLHGGTPAREFAELKRRYIAGEIPIICLSQVGHEGHNLQVNSGNVHLDVPPVPDGIEQRAGRGERIGSPHESIWTSIPYIIGAGTEHMVKLVAPRGSVNHQILDAPEGVRPEDSTLAGQLGEITRQVAAHKKQEGYLETAERLRVAAHIFGAA